MVFTRTKRSADRIAADLAERGFAAAAVHGDLGQGAREQALRAFRNGKVDILVATDVAARGIDVAGVTHVINYECPDDEKTYLHRIGRTGRAGEPGVAITFVDWDDGYRWGMINKALDLPFPEPEETYSTSDVLYAELDIPRERTGRLPRAQRTRAGLDAEVLEDLGETGRRTPGRSGTPGLATRLARPAEPLGRSRQRAGEQPGRPGGPPAATAAAADPTLGCLRTGQPATATTGATTATLPPRRPRCPRTPPTAQRRPAGGVVGDAPEAVARSHPPTRKAQPPVTPILRCMVMRTVGTRERAESVEDLAQWVEGLKGCPPIGHTTVARCFHPSHGDEPPTWFYVEADPRPASPGCAACPAVTSTSSSTRLSAGPSRAAWACPACSQSIAEVVYGVSERGGKADWLAVAVRCVECGDVAGVCDLVLPSLDLDLLLGAL